MKVIVITVPDIVEHEAELIVAALQSGADRVHIRKPNWSVEQMEYLIKEIPSEFRSRISLHDQIQLAQKFSLGGIHLNGRNPSVAGYSVNFISRSCHSLSELKESANLSYRFLSPIFDSISKSGYGANFSMDELKNAKIDRRTIALGGVTPDTIPTLYNLGFGGVALLGYVWSDYTIDGVSKRVSKAVKMAMMCQNFSLQYITHNNGSRGEVDGARLAMNGGCSWVQLRMKGASDDIFIENAKILKRECTEQGVTFILNDRADLVVACNADGVHLGREDMSPSEARKILGDGKIIGGTANTIEDIERLISEGVDYIGYGPFRFTSTKERLSPVLGLEGYSKAIEYIKSRGYTTPIVAIGGIGVDDIDSIMKCGVSGIAISGTILNAEDPALRTKQIIAEISKSL